MRILIVNDDGIRSPGLISLAKMAVQLGEVWVVAPDNQCSAMSQRISVFGSIHVREVPDFPVRDARAWSISGSPADCVKVALSYVMKEKPDVVFSGINNGYNVGVDILYSGTVGAAIEALVNGIPAIAFSNKTNDDQRVSERYLLPIAKDLLTREIEPWAIWHVNFPACDPDEIKGLLEDRVLRNDLHAGWERGDTGRSAAGSGGGGRVRAEFGEGDGGCGRSGDAGYDSGRPEDEGGPCNEWRRGC